MRERALLSVHLHVHLACQVESTLGAHRVEALLRLAQPDAVVRSGRTGDAPGHGRQVQLHHVGVRALGGVEIVPEALRLSVGLHKRHLLGIFAGQAQVFEGAPVHGKQRARAAVLRGHVGDAGALRGRQAGQPLAEAFHEAADHALGAQRLRERERDVHGGHARLQRARQPDAHDARHQRGDGLPERRGLGLDAADAPS